MNQPSPHTLNSRRSPFMQTVLIAMFAALSFVAIWLIRIPYPAPVGNPFIHFGNMVTILAALLIGGWQGGLSGSIGMGLFDIVGGYGIDSLKTFILKFGIGLFTGLVARIGRRHPERNPRVGLGVAGGISLAMGLTALIGKLAGWSLLAKAADISYVLLLIIGVLLTALTVAACRTEKLTNETLFAALGATAGIAFNVVGEFVGGVITKVISGAELPAAMLASVMSLPATFINGTVSIVGAVLLYVPLKAALIKARFGHLLA